MSPFYQISNRLASFFWPFVPHFFVELDDFFLGRAIHIQDNKRIATALIGYFSLPFPPLAAPRFHMDDSATTKRTRKKPISVSSAAHKRNLYLTSMDTAFQ
jgi:hypothetical protein